MLDHAPARAQPLPARARTALGRVLGSIADVIVPPCCLVCRTPLAAHHALCAACWRDVHFIRAPLCDVLGIPLPFDTGGRVVSAGALVEVAIPERRYPRPNPGYAKVEFGDHQTAAAHAMIAAVDSAAFSVTLIDGVTGMPGL